MNPKILSFLSIIFLCVFVLKEKTLADPWFNYPGTRARAMGGAFVAIADDSSACWYNPAGLATKGSDFSLEVYQMATPDAFYDNEKDSNGFIGFKIGNQKIGIGFLFFAPYKIPIYMHTSYNSLSGEDIHIYSGFYETVYLSSVGFAFGNKVLKLGISFENLFLDYRDSYLYYLSDYGYYTKKIEEDYNVGVSGSIGTLLHLGNLKDDSLNIKIGAVYRFPSSVEPKEELIYYDNYSDTSLYLNWEKVLFKKPSSYDIGISTTISLSNLGYLIISSQYGEIDYSTIKDSYNWKYNKFSIGNEFGLLLSKDALLSFRTGMYVVKSIGREYYDEKISGVTYGFGINLERRFVLEIAIEKRKYKLEDYIYNFTKEYSTDFLAVSLNICF